MYPEFIAIYIGLGILSLLQIATIVLVVVLLKKKRHSSDFINSPDNRVYPNSSHSMASGVAFCINCGAQFNSELKVCPKCGYPRR